MAGEVRDVSAAMSHLSPGLPGVTATFVFTDIEGSTKLLARLGDQYARVLEDHRSLIRQAVDDAGGTVVDTEGDGFFLVFPTPSSALRAAVAAQSSLAAHPFAHDVELRVRMGLHTGEAAVAGTSYLGLEVHRAARIAATAHGGQVVVSDATRVLVEDALPDTVTLKDLGHHRLKDLTRPQHLFQLVAPGLASAFPALRSLDARPNNLPSQVTSFVGRQRERGEVRRLLPQSRLLTLTGPGGTGKSRLAVEVAGDLLGEFPDGVFLVKLGGLRDPALIAPTIAQALGLTATDRPVLQALKDHLEPLRLLLILDNFEHLLPGAPLVRELLEAAPQLRALVTSRARLHLSGEQELPVPPMELPWKLPELDVLCRCEAVALFTQRARAADPGFNVTRDNAAAVAEICVRLDGLPLAIELAAARLNVLTPRLLLQRMEPCLPLLSAGPWDMPDRQRTLLNTIAWSHDLLDPADKALFRRLSVFSGGCTVAAAEAVVGLDGVEMLEGLSSLVEKNLLWRARESADEPRFGMLETIREYAHDQLVESGEAEDMDARHSRFYLEFASRRQSQLTRGPQSGMAGSLQAELDNLRAVIRRSIRAGDAETGLRMASSLWRFWQQRGQLEEGRRWMARLLALPLAAPRTATRAKALNAAAGMAYWQGDYAEAQAYGEESLSIWRELGDQGGAAEALHSLAYLAGIRGDHGQAHRLHEESRAMAQELGDLRCVADNLVGDGMVSQVQGDTEGARARFEQARGLFEDLGESYGLASVLCLLSRIAVERGDLAGAGALWCEAFQLLGDLGDTSGMIIALSDLCAIELACGRPEAAVRLAGAADGLGESLKVQPPKALTQPPDPRPAASRAMGAPAMQAAWRAGRAMSLEDAIAYARELAGLDITVSELGSE
ncbi:MAG: tetratricopeptide repeat protein [Actinobacteria bacterium]|nr:tetratricopeptide repeat protein [Actinomycetota bacterium]